LLVPSPVWCSVAVQCLGAGALHPCWCISWCLVQVRINTAGCSATGALHPAAHADLLQG
jgi:hypothetical protein